MAKNKPPRNVVFFHPDLGIGGAERLVIDAAVGLQEKGHKVTIFTSHCDPAHCFDEARDGTLDVRVRGNTIVPPNIFGRFAILCAILRQLHLILQIAFLSSELRQLKPDVFFIDQLSAGIPLLRILSYKTRILFYCHFPDKLLAQKGGILKSLYRIPFDEAESYSTGCADRIVVNSGFTASVFAKAFPDLKDRRPDVVYPCVDTSNDYIVTRDDPPYFPKENLILSINRFERKKDIGLAIKAFAQLPESCQAGARLVLAGGYDTRVTENVEYHKELGALAESLGLQHATAKTIVSALAIPTEVKVLFLLSVPNAVKTDLLLSAKLVVYTPKNEHLGIVPIEAMHHGTPVLAANEGGPTETVDDGTTGWLRDSGDVIAWAKVMRDVLDGSYSKKRLQKMGEDGQERVKQLFSKDVMAGVLVSVIEETLRARSRPSLFNLRYALAALAVVVSINTAFFFTVKR
ncbi:UDP-Glycosyltransferase/glycogen phosphorylase [Microthyrium microscopicum]|uniref:Alpha-1,3/1,6-mannosyltransferase ALG2 n=1 Tax=Microthyrium microscopicum TaxID=703497 RepID=A0A6A6UJ06_9PEZI|nr:UDP-Glycosyltransferase/glycogen phosphorylase [Microthyrium microscopicum]